ncbi:solute carrier family 41 member 1 [Hysterangium stoloniferum]|nr:solute carrier family 41 member 1 [Hysterangium stoloniferum]
MVAKLFAGFPKDVHNGSVERLELATLDGHQAEPPKYGDNDSDEENDLNDDRALLGGPSRKAEDAPGKKIAQENASQFVYGILLETIPTLLLTTLGLTFTGEMLERVADWNAIKRVDELYILIPMLNNLKGNLEMNLSSRLSTAANIGELNSAPRRRKLLLGNISLLQVQALILSFVAAVLSFLLGWMLPVTPEAAPAPSTISMFRRQSPSKPTVTASKAGIKEFIVLLSTSMASASISGLILGSFMYSLIIICCRLSRDPDNITPPVASCLGDLLTLCIIGLVSSVLVQGIDTLVPVGLTIFLVVAVTMAILVTLRNDVVRPLLSMGWIPLLGAMVISSGTGMVLDRFVNQYGGFGLLSIVLGGLPGSVGSVFVSRLSTTLHATSADHDHRSPISKTHGDISRNFLTTLTLFLVTLPVLVLFLVFIQTSGWTKFPPLFLGIFVVFFCCTVLASLTIARLLTQFLWSKDLDPDTYAMPIHSSLVDLVGQLMLVACFEFSQALGADVKNKIN